MPFATTTTTKCYEEMERDLTVFYEGYCRI